MTPTDPHPPAAALRGAPDTLDDDTVDRLFASVAEATIDREPGWRDRLRELPTPSRAALAGAAALSGSVGVTLVHGVRMDLSGAALAQTVAVSAGLVGVGIGAAALALRSLHRPTPLRVGALVTALLGAPVAVSLVPGLVPGDLSPIGPAVHLICGLGTLVTAVIASLAVLVFDRSDRPTPWRLATVGAAGGLFGLAGGLMQCHHVEWVHLLLGHGCGGVLVAGALVTVGHLRAGA